MTTEKIAQKQLTLKDKEDYVMGQVADRSEVEYVNYMNDVCSRIELLSIFPHHLLLRAKSIGGNMVINNYGTIMFNMSGTSQEDGSYREIKGYDISKDFLSQSPATKEAIYELVLSVNKG